VVSRLDLLVSDLIEFGMETAVIYVPESLSAKWHGQSERFARNKCETKVGLYPAFRVNLKRVYVLLLECQSQNGPRFWYATCKFGAIGHFDSKATLWFNGVSEKSQPRRLHRRQPALKNAKLPRFGHEFRLSVIK